jgi:hypothetical protein
MVEDRGDDPLVNVMAGARVRDRFCSEVHTLRRPNRAESDALLLYDCATNARDIRAVAGTPQTTHVGAILGRLVGGLERVDD